MKNVPLCVDDSIDKFEIYSSNKLWLLSDIFLSHFRYFWLEMSYNCRLGKRNSIGYKLCSQAAFTRDHLLTQLLQLPLPISTSAIPHRKTYFMTEAKIFQGSSDESWQYLFAMNGIFCNFITCFISIPFNYAVIVRIQWRKM